MSRVTLHDCYNITHGLTFKAECLLYVRPALPFVNPTLLPHSIFKRLIYNSILEWTISFLLYINWVAGIAQSV